MVLLLYQSPMLLVAFEVWRLYHTSYESYLVKSTPFDRAPQEVVYFEPLEFTMRSNDDTLPVVKSLVLMQACT